MAETYGIKGISELDNASPSNLQNDYFIISRNGVDGYRSYKTTFSSISTALCAVLAEQIVIPTVDISIRQLSGITLSSVADLLRQTSPQNYVGNGILLKELNTKIDTKQPKSSTGSTTHINGITIFDDSCPQTQFDPVNDNDLVRLGYLNSVLNQAYCDANNLEEIYAKPVLTGDYPGALQPNETCPVIIENDTNGQVLVNIAGASSNIGVFLYTNPESPNYTEEIREISKTSTKLKQNFEKFTLLNTDAAAGYSYNVMLPIKGGQIICIFPKTQRISVKYNYLNWKSLGITDAKKEQYESGIYKDYRLLNVPGVAQVSTGVYKYEDFTKNKSKLLQKVSTELPSKFRVVDNKDTTKLKYQYVTKASSTSIKKVIPAIGQFPTGTTIEVSRLT